MKREKELAGTDRGASILNIGQSVCRYREPETKLSHSEKWF